MFIEDVDIKNISNPKLSLHKPNNERTQISNLTHAYEILLNKKLGGVDELSFSLPLEIEKRNKLVDNPDIEKIKNRYLVKCILNDEEKYFQIREPRAEMIEEQDFKNFTCYSLEIQLIDKLLIGLQETSVNATEILNKVLNNTTWTIKTGGIPASFNLKYRSFEVNSKTVLDFLLDDIQTTFNCIVLFDTINKEISLIDLDLYGQNNYITFEYGKYLNTLNQEFDDENFCTKLIVRGKDNLGIQRVTPTGQNYLENLNWFIYPFEKNEAGEIVKHSDYMSDNLVEAILAYNDLLETKQDEFDNLLTQKEGLQTTLTTKMNELYDLQTELQIILDNIDVAQSNGDDTTQLLIDKDNKQTEIDTKQSEIDNINADINNINSQIDIIKTEIAIENNFTQEQIIERDQFIIEKEITNQYITDDKELLNWGKQEFEKIQSPQMKIDIDIVNFLQCLDPECRRDAEKGLLLGDLVYIKHPKLDINIQAKIFEIEYDFENPESGIVLTIANIKELMNDKERFLKLINNSINSSTQINLNKYKYEEAYSKSNEVQQILDETWDSALRSIKSGVNDSVTIDRRGLTSIDSEDPNKAIRITNSVIGLTQDGFNSLGVAINPTGVFAEYLVGNIILGQNLHIDFSDTDGTKIFQVNPSVGVQIQGSSLTITNGLPEDQINSTSTDKWNNAVFQGSLYNGIKIDTTNGFVATRSDVLTRTIANATDGILIQQNTGTVDTPIWEDKLFADINGNLTVEDLRAKRIIIRNNNDDILINANTNTIDFTKFNTILGSISGTNINLKNTSVSDGTQTTFSVDNDGNVSIYGNITMNGGSISWVNVTAPDYSQITGSKPPVDAEPNPSYITSTKITSTTIESPTIVGGSITSNTTIDVSTDANIGQFLNLQSYSGGLTIDAGIRFKNGTNIESEIFYDSSTESLEIYGKENLKLGRTGSWTNIYGYVHLENATSITWGDHAPVAKFG